MVNATEFHDFVRVPPNSTGHRLTHGKYIVAQYQNADVLPEVGMLVVGDTSGTRMVLVYVQEGSTLSQGIIGLNKRFICPNELEEGEIIKDSDGQNLGTISEITEYHQPVNHIAGGNNTTNIANVDKKGSISTRFSEGDPKFDAFGKMQTSQMTTIGEYSFHYRTGEQDDFDFTNYTSGGGSITYDGSYSAQILNTTEDSNSIAQKTSNKYHSYRLGMAQSLMMGLEISDTGKDSVIRRWGYFDDEDGLYFELNGNELYVVIRSSVTGEIQEKRIPRSEWNKDSLTGEGDQYNPSSVDLNIDKNIIYGIDFQWLGAGSIRFSVNIHGNRIIVHEEHNSNYTNRPFMRTGTLPLRIEQLNDGIPSSSSQMKFYSAGVYTHTRELQPYKYFSYAGQEVVTIESSEELTTLGVLRPKKEFKGQDNRGFALIEEGTLYTADNPVVLMIFLNPEVTGDTWEIETSDDSIIEMDRSGSITGGRLVKSVVVEPGSTKDLHFDKIFHPSSYAIRRLADIDNYHSLGLAAKLIGTETTDIYYTFDWKEFV